jgi:hypothetical protein
MKIARDSLSPRLGVGSTSLGWSSPGSGPGRTALRASSSSPIDGVRGFDLCGQGQRVIGPEVEVAELVGVDDLLQLWD